MKDNAEENYISSLRKVQHFQREKLIISYVLTLYSVMHPPYPTVKLQHPETLHVTQSVTALHCTAGMLWLNVMPHSASCFLFFPFYWRLAK